MTEVHMICGYDMGNDIWRNDRVTEWQHMIWTYIPETTVYYEYGFQRQV